MNTLCFTGHRKINGVYRGPAHTALAAKLLEVVIRAYGQGFKTFISGGAIGVDTLGAQAVLGAQATGEIGQPLRSDINLIMARPFPSQSCKWPEPAQRELERLCAAAHKVFDVSPDPYAIWKMQKRNIWMVDQAHAVIAVWDGNKAGGTWNCIEYALGKKKPVLVIHPVLLTETWY